MQYKQTLSLNDHEVVITFDDSPLPPYTDVILKILESQCGPTRIWYGTSTMKATRSARTP